MKLGILTIEIITMNKIKTEFVDTRKKYILLKNDIGVTDFAREGRIYEEYMYDYITKYVETKNTTIVDVGANLGFHTLEFADLVENGQVFAFEPQKIVYYQLCGNIILNGFTNVTAYNFGVGNSNKKIRVENQDYSASEKLNIGNTHLDAFTHAGYNEVDLVKLDDFKFNNLSIIKIDVQGYEVEVLKGAINTINEHRPVIFIEIEPPQLAIYNKTKEDVLNVLNQLNYKVEKIHEYAVYDYVATPN